MLSNLEIVLSGVRFPENVGMAARACANMGCSRLTLVTSKPWSAEKAKPLATAKGLPVLESLRVCADLKTALSETVLTVGTTARVGGWRRGILSPQQAAAAIVPLLTEGRVAIVFGSEDRGLENDEITLCHHLVSIPTCGEASSLNVAQAVLVLLYECMKAAAEQNPVPKHTPGEQSRLATHDETERLLAVLRRTLLRIDYLRDDNPDYFLLPVRRFLGKTRLRRHETDMLMGICRQITILADRAAPDNGTSALKGTAQGKTE